MDMFTLASLCVDDLLVVGRWRMGGRGRGGDMKSKNNGWGVERQVAIVFVV